jgi:hypothetical protein
VVDGDVDPEGRNEMKQRWKYLTAAVVASVAVAGGVVATAQAASFSPPQPCSKSGHIAYTINRAANPTADQSSAYDAIDGAMKQALSFDNCYLDVTKSLSVDYDTSVPTADGDESGHIRFGSDRQYMTQATAMHEISHTLGVGTDAKWGSNVVNGAWTGNAAITALHTITGDTSSVLHADTQHFWPYGLNQNSEVHSADDLVDHCLILVALRHDMGLDG